MSATKRVTRLKGMVPKSKEPLALADMDKAIMEGAYNRAKGNGPGPRGIKMKFAIDYIAKLQKALSGLDTGAIGEAAAWLKEARDKGRMVFVIGNGGSAAVASHLAVDLVKGASYGRPAKFKVMGLADCVPTVMAYVNDVGGEAVFVEQLKNFAGPGDVVIAISGSGDSPNILAAVEYANGAGCKTIAMTRAVD